MDPMNTDPGATSQPSPFPGLEVEQSIAALLREPQGTQASQHKALIRDRLGGLARQLLEGGSSLPPAPRGGDFLFSLAKIDPQMFLEWWGMVGEIAWQASKNDPFLLLDWLSVMEDFHPADEDMARAVRAAVEQGMQMAMPLRLSEFNPRPASLVEFMDRADEVTSHRHPEADGSGASENLETLKNRVLAQEGLVRLAIFGAPLWASRGWLFEKVQEYRGAPLFSYTMVRGLSTQCPSVTPRTLIGLSERASGDWGFRWGTWLEIWNDHRDKAKDVPGRVLSWMAGNGVETIPITDRVFVEQVQEKVGRNGAKKATRWLEALTLLENNPAGLGNDSNTGIPFAFLALQADRSLLAEALKRPPPGGLDAKGSLGETIWDSLLFPSAEDADLHAPGASAIRSLLKEVPLSCRSTQGFLWHADRMPWVRALARETLHSHPNVWLGDESAAMRGALEALVALVSAPLFYCQTNALDAFERLFALDKADPTLLDPEIKDVMRAAHVVLSSYPDVEKTGKVSITSRYSAPDPRGTQWHEKLEKLLNIRNINPASTLPGIELLEKRLASHVSEVQMEASLSQAPEIGASPLRPKVSRF